MFGWFKPKFAIEQSWKLWIEGRLNWLIRTFGIERLRQVQVVTPTSDFFPWAFKGTKADAQAVFELVCEHMQLDSSELDLFFFDDRADAQRKIGINASGPIGLYVSGDEATGIGLDVSCLHDPQAVVATMAHELAHFQLLGGGFLTGDERDHEPLTDLATVYFGFGVFSANSTLREQYWHSGQYSGWSMARQGYLSFPTYAYALASFAWARGEREPPWARFLRPDVRSPFKTALEYLFQTGDTTILEESDTSAELEIPPDLVEVAEHEDSQSSDHELTSERKNRKEFGDDTQDDPIPVDDWYTAGIQSLATGDYEAALDSFNRAIELQPDDSESYQHRAEANFELGRYAEAIHDANAALRLDPDNTEAHRFRGHAHSGLKAWSSALKDFDCVLKVNRADADALWGRAQALIEIIDYQQALRSLTAAIRSEPSWVGLYLARADVYDKLGQADKARTDRLEAETRA